MADIKELFDMVTNKTEPDLDSWKEQEDRQRKLARNRRMGAFGVAAVIVLLAAFTVVALRRGDGGGSPASEPPESPPGATVITNRYLDIATGERTPVAANLTGARLSEVSPNGEAVAYNTCCADTAIYVAQLDGSTIEMITPEELDGYGATWIDDETILFQGRPEGTFELGDLYTVNVNHPGEVAMVVDMPDERNGAWIVNSDLSPDGSTVLYHLPRGRGDEVVWDLWMAPLAGGEPSLLREDAGFAQYTANGSIVFLDHPFPFVGDEIWIMDGDGENARLIVGDGGTYQWPRVSPDGTMVAYGYADGSSLSNVEVVNIESGQVTAFGGSLSEEPAWFGNDTLIVD